MNAFYNVYDFLMRLFQSSVRCLSMWIICFAVPAFSQPFSQVYLKGEHFFPQLSDSTDRMNYTSLYFDLKEESRFRSILFKVDGITEVFLDKKPLIYFNLLSLFASYTYNFSSDAFFQIQSLEVTLGRRIYSWSQADNYWELGLWNSLSTWNPLTPSQTGLIGAFFDLQGQKWNFQFFAGGIYLPNQGVRIKLENDENEKPAYFYSSSRWFAHVPRQVRTGDSLFDIDYYKRKTSISEVLLQKSSAVSFKIRSGGQQNYWMRGSMGYKPVNEPFSIRNIRDIVRVPGKQGQDPHIEQIFAFFPVNHQVLALEWGMDYKGLSLLFSVGDDRLFQVSPPEGWIFVREQEDFSYLSGLLKYKHSFSGKLDSFAQLSFISSRITGVPLEDQKGDFSRRSRYKITDGVGFDLNSQWKVGDRIKWDASFQYWYSFPDQGGLLSLSGNFWISEKLFTGAGLFILGAQEEMKTFLNYFRANDYFFWKVGYVF